MVLNNAKLRIHDVHVIFVRARSITGIITENISYLFRKFADPTRMFSSEIQLRFSEIYVSMFGSSALDLLAGPEPLPSSPARCTSTSMGWSILSCGTVR